MGFLNLKFLFYLFLILPLGLFLFAKTNLRKKLINFFNLNLKYSMGKYLYFPLFVVFFLIFSLSRPYFGYQDIEVNSLEKDLMLILDVSPSMLTNDVNPSRLIQAKRKGLRLIENIKGSEEQWRIGLVLMSGVSYLACPLTNDFSVVESFIKNSSEELISAKGSSINEAIRVSLSALNASSSTAPRVLIFSDGEDDNLKIEKAIKLLKESKISLSSIAFGTKEGKPIPLSNGKYLKDKSDNIIISKTNFESLRKITNSSKGIALRASVGDSDLKTILSSYQNLTENDFGAKNLKSANVRSHNEVGPFIVIFLLFVTFIAILREKNFVLICLLLTLPLNSRADSRDAYKAYKKNNYEEALKLFEEEFSNNKENKAVKQGLASTLYKLKKYEKAQKLFNELATETKIGREKFDNLYNSGNSNFKAKKYKEAIEDYNKALEIKREDKKTKHNIGLAKKLLQEKKKQEEKDNKDNKDNKDKNKEDKKEKGEKKEEKEDSSKSDDSSKKNKKEESDKTNNEKSQKNKDKKDENKKNKEEEKEDRNKQEPQNDKSKKENKESQDEKEEKSEPLSTKAARAWLDSLPETPIGLKKNINRKKSGSRQTW